MTGASLDLSTGTLLCLRRSRGSLSASGLTRAELVVHTRCTAQLRQLKPLHRLPGAVPQEAAPESLDFEAVSAFTLGSPTKAGSGTFLPRAHPEQTRAARRQTRQQEHFGSERIERFREARSVLQESRQTRRAWCVGWETVAQTGDLLDTRVRQIATIPIKLSPLPMRSFFYRLETGVSIVAESLRDSTLGC